MIEREEISRVALLMLMLSVILCALPHYERLPLWTSGVVIGALVWRYMVFHERWRFPNGWVRAFLVFLVFGGVFVGYGTLLGPEVNTALLVNAIALKMLELYRKRDAFLIVMLNYFVVAMAFLFSRGIFQSMYILFATVMVTAVLVSIHRAGKGRPFADIRVAMRLVVHSIPLMLILFVMIPRIGPLWSVDLGRQAAKSGMSDFMSPGDIGKLARNGDLAFRVEFEGDMPPPNWLYWRGMTLNDFDGRRWTQGVTRGTTLNLTRFNTNAMKSEWYKDLKLEANRYTGESYRYTIIMESTQQPWLYALKVPIPVFEKDLTYSRDYRISKYGAVETLFQYKVNSYPELPMDTGLPDWVREMALDLPEGFNPRSIERARQWRGEAASDRDYMDRVLWWFNREEFRYTLEPAPLGRHTADEFLFDTREGFCEHYASSFVVMMRAAGIPARVVIGYMGGEFSDVGRYLLVHQYDAHAWAEVWFPGTGWERVDPTEMVAPERIERGLEEALGDEGTFLEGSGFNLARFNFLDAFRLAVDYMDYAWAKWVLGYDSDRQMELLSNLLGSVTPQKMAVVMIIASVIFLVFMSVILYLQRPARHHDPVIEAYIRLLRRMKKSGFPVETGDTPADLMRKVNEEEKYRNTALPELLATFVALQYQPGTGSAALRHEFISGARKASRKL